MGGTLAVAGIHMSDLEFISLRTLGAMVVVSSLGILVVRRLAGRSVGTLVLIVVIVSVICSMAGIGIIAMRMLSGANQDVVLDLMAIAGLSALIVALLVLAITGLLTLMLRDTDAFAPVLVIHLCAVMVSFAIFPYTKFVHVIYRFLALIHDSSER